MVIQEWKINYHKISEAYIIHYTIDFATFCPFADIATLEHMFPLITMLIMMMSMMTRTKMFRISIERVLESNIFFSHLE